MSTSTFRHHHETSSKSNRPAAPSTTTTLAAANASRSSVSQVADERPSRPSALSAPSSSCSYIIEPMAFVQNLASSIMGFSLGLFMYNRILARLIDAANKAKDDNSTTTASWQTTSAAANIAFAAASSNTSGNLCGDSGDWPVNRSHSSSSSVGIIDSIGSEESPPMLSMLLFLVQQASARLVTLPLGVSLPAFDQLHQHVSESWHSSDSSRLSPEQLERIRVEAQMATAHLYYVSVLYSGVPLLLATLVLGMNSSVLGRKPLLVGYLAALCARYALVLTQCLVADAPDWLFYAGAVLEASSGGVGVFYLALFCYVSDLSGARARSYRITLLISLNSAASLAVTLGAGYAIKYYGYAGLFAASCTLVTLALAYTVWLVPETFAPVCAQSWSERLRACSLRRSRQCVRVYFTDVDCLATEPAEYKEPQTDEAADEQLAPTSYNVDDLIAQQRETCEDERHNERSPLIDVVAKQQQQPQPSRKQQKKQSFVLLFIVFANFVYNFGTIGVSSIFTLYLMNAPFCFDSVDLSHYAVFATVAALCASLLVARCVRCASSDLLVCAASVASYGLSVLLYIYGTDARYVYAAALVSSIGGLEYGYARSIISKAMAPGEVADALALVLIVDTLIAVASGIVFPTIYAHIVAASSGGMAVLFWFSNVFVLIAFLCHLVNYALYKPAAHSSSGT